LIPDAESHEGDIFAAVRRFKMQPGTIPAAEIGFKLLKEFTPAQDVSGIGFAGDLAGLRVVSDTKQRGKMSIEIGKGWVDRLTPALLQFRLNELIKAAQMTTVRQTGVVPAT
jgi:hypothetical protein